jgi:tRNA modification GTPase
LPAGIRLKTSSSLANAILRALSETRRRIEQAQAQLPRLELFAEELRLAQLALATITGEFSADDLLGEIFGRFCIGK